jgi:hypothetical protein
LHGTKEDWLSTAGILETLGVSMGV